MQCSKGKGLSRTGKRKLYTQAVPSVRPGPTRPGRSKRQKLVQRENAPASSVAERKPTSIPPSTGVYRNGQAVRPVELAPSIIESLHSQSNKFHRVAPGDVDIVLQRALNVGSEQELKDLLNCLILSESAYKIVDMGRTASLKLVMRMKKSFPPGLVTVERVQWSLSSVYHRYLVADDKDSLYVSFMGTKQRRDLVTNAAVLQESVWPEMTADGDQKAGAVPAAHRGFLSRAGAIPIEGLYAHACRQGKRLVLTGHSLGGAVAALSTLRLLKQLPQGAQPAVRCVTFACPAIGNLALSEFVRSAGWEHLFQNLLVPEDVVPRLLASPEQSPEQVAAATIAALQPEEAKKIGDEFVEATMDLFADIFDAVSSDDPLLAPSLGAAYALPRSESGDQHPSNPSSASKLCEHKPNATAAGRRKPAAAKNAVSTSSSTYPTKIYGQLTTEQRQPSDKEIAIQPASMFGGLEQGDEVVLGALDLPEGERPGQDGSLDLEEEEERAEMAALRGEHRSKQASATAGSAKAGRSVRRAFGHERLTSSEEVFFPWSANPLPNFARKVAGQALKTAGNFGRLRGRRLPFAKQKDKATALQQPSSGWQTLPRVEQSSAPFVPSNMESNLSTNSKLSSTNTQSPRYASQQSSTEETGFCPQSPQLATGLIPSKQTNGQGSMTQLWRRANGQTIGKLSANVGRAARGAARIVSAPLRVAQRSYAVLGKQAFLSTTGILPATEGETEQSFQKGLEGATESSRASALAFPGSRGASPSTIVSLQLPIAAARRRQPFLMHKMAFHRARILSIVECTLAEAGVTVPRQPYLESSTESLLSADVAPPMKPSRADVFLPYSLPDNEDLKTILDDLGTLSALPPMTCALQQSRGSRRFQWLKPWRWISGFGWGGASKRGTVELTAQVRGTGLENCSSVQVQEPEQGIWCRTEIVYQPQQPSPYEMYRQLGLHRSGVLRRAACLAFWAKQAVSQVTSTLDRTNVMGAADCLLVKVYLPLEVMEKMETRLLQQTGDDSGLILHMASDFRKAQVPLQVHGGGSWLISDLRSSSQSLNEWITQKLTG